MERDVAGLRFQFAVVAEGCATGGENLPATAAPARATGTVRLERSVAKFACSSPVSGDQVPIGKNPGPNTLGDCHQNNIVNSVEAAKRKLCDQAGVCGVFHLYGQAHLRFDGALQVEIGPAQIRCKYQALGCGINPAGQAYSN